MSDQPRILSVGQCGLDGPRIRRELEKTFDAQVSEADSVDEATGDLDGGFDLVLVNRILDATGEQGQRVVEAAAERGVKVMLVSNYDDAQEKAIAAGAKPGFGKGKLGSEEATATIREALDA